MQFVPFDLYRHGAWVKELLHPVFCEDTKGIVAIRDGVPVGVMLGDSWSRNSVNVHIGIVDPLVFKHKMHYEFCEYVFHTCDRGQMLGLVPADNEKALKLNKHFGFREVYRIKDGYDVGVDYVVMQYTKEECKYLGEENGWEEQSSRSAGL